MFSKSLPSIGMIILKHKNYWMGSARIPSPISPCHLESPLTLRSTIPSADVFKEFAEYWHDNIEAQKLLDGFSENTLTNFPVPFGIAPNFKINDTIYAVPMVTEESSVVAAASNAAKFWLSRGGFKTEVISTKKVGQVHFIYHGAKEKLFSFFASIKDDLKKGVQH